MITNAEIASILSELARLTVLEDGSPQSFRVRAYEKAARAVEIHDEPLAPLTAAQITKVPGLGASSAKKIRELADTGRLAKLDSLRETFPPAFVEVTRIPGVGPKTALMLRESLGVESVDDLKRAVGDQALRDLPGLGAKTEENIARSIERLGIGGKDRRTPIVDAMRIAQDMVAALEAMPGVDRAVPMGSLRRFSETIGDVDIIAVSEGDSGAIMEWFTTMSTVTDVVGFGAKKSSVIVGAGIQVDLRVMTAAQFGSASMYFTGSKAHNIRLRQLAMDRGWILNEYGLSDSASGDLIASETEEDVYAALDLPWIPPELREDTGEVQAAIAGSLPDLVDVGHLRGDLHVHTDLSGDGRDSIEAMLDAVVARGLTYVAITDHAEDLVINGASRDEMLAQRAHIDELCVRYPDLTVLHGAELNIGPEGSIDYDRDYLAGFDFGVASVHSQFDLPADVQTQRVITAMSNLAVNVIGHLTGRMIGRRPGIELDVDAVLSAAVETGCGIEINSHLQRLDASADVLRRAVGSDVVFVISTDAHDTRELANSMWGVRNARRGWVRRDRVANTWETAEFLAWVASKRGR